MQVAAYTASNSPDNGMRSQQPRVLAGLRPPPPGAGPFDHSLEDIGEWQGGQLPGLYLLLLSRIENSLATNEDARVTLERLERLLSHRLQQLPTIVQRHLTALPGYERLGLRNLGELPRAARLGLLEREQADAMLALLKSPAFVAAMKDTPQASTYGPQGMLRAS